MKGLLYLSKSLAIDNEHQVDELRQKFTGNNQKLAVTGYLCFLHGRFIQYLEGDAENLDILMKRIRSDNRHEILYELDGPSIEKRVFPTWGMRYLRSSELESFNIEAQVSNNLLLIKNDFLEEDRCREILWNHLESISKAWALQQRQ